MPTLTRGMGWLPSIPDYRDISYSVSKRPALPPNADLRPKFQPVYDQSVLSSCTSNAIAGIYEYILRKEGKADWMPSRLFIYYNERAMENSIASDCGAQIRDGIKSLNQIGVCSEDEWQYDINKFADKPTANAYADAAANKIHKYASIPDLYMMKHCLAHDQPFVFGFSVYSAFMSDEVASTGILNMPTRGERLEGGHAVVAVGYDDATQRFIVRNSYGRDWGMGGYFSIPYEYLTNENLAADFWCISQV